MIRGVWNFVKRHRRKFFFAGAVVGGIIVLGKYAKWKLREIQDIEAADYLEHARKQHHFDSNQRTCSTTVLSMLPSLREALMKALDTETLTEHLKHKPANRIQLWEQLKISSFTRTICAVYSSCMLVLLLRAQLNIIGGYMYVDNFMGRNGTTRDLTLASPGVQQKYLESIQYVLGQGLSDLAIAVQMAVEAEMSSLSLKENMYLTSIEQIIQRIRRRMESPEQINGCHHEYPLNEFMLPKKFQPDGACSLSQEELFHIKLLSETKDVTEMNDFQYVLNCCLDQGFSKLLDRVAEFFQPEVNSQGNKFTNPNDVHMPVAKVIPIMNGLVHVVCGDTPNVFIQELLLIDQVKTFAANIYEAFSQPEENIKEEQI